MSTHDRCSHDVLVERHKLVLKSDKRSKKESCVYQLTNASRCHHCDRKLESGEVAKLVNKDDEREVLCTDCAGLDEFTFLPKGNAKETRLAKKYSEQHFIVLKWSALWKTYERQGLYVAKEALARARHELE